MVVAVAVTATRAGRQAGSSGSSSGGNSWSGEVTSCIREQQEEPPEVRLALQQQKKKIIHGRTHELTVAERGFVALQKKGLCTCTDMDSF